VEAYRRITRLSARRPSVFIKLFASRHAERANEREVSLRRECRASPIGARLRRQTDRHSSAFRSGEPGLRPILRPLVHEGELVYQLKYRNGPAGDIVETAVAFVTDRWNGVIECVVPPPPSLHRANQPAVLIEELADVVMTSV
jgi:hypothetical protein